MIATTVSMANADSAMPTHVHLPPFTSPEHISTGENSRTELPNVLPDSTVDDAGKKHVLLLRCRPANTINDTLQSLLVAANDRRCHGLLESRYGAGGVRAYTGQALGGHG